MGKIIACPTAQLTNLFSRVCVDFKIDALFTESLRGVGHPGTRAPFKNKNKEKNT